MERFTLPAEFGIYGVGELRAQCLARLAGCGSDDGLAIDASAVVEIDAAGVQWLLSLANEMQRQRRPLQLLAPSAALASACTALGASALFDGAAQGGGHG